jgi:hypothetical protein
MSKKENNGYSKHCLVKKINGIKIYFYKSWDVVHGKGFFAHSITDDFKTGFGFHKTNKLTAVRQSLNVA